MNKKRIFWILGGILVVGIFGVWWYMSQNFSKEILRLEILGPDTATMGDEIQYTVKYKNNGNFTLQQPKLVFELPDNSLTEDSKTRLTQDLQDIYPGQEQTVQFKARLLGKEGDLKVAHAWLSYVPENLSARYESDTTFTTTINTVPITLTFDLPSNAEKGKEITYNINYFSNIDYPLENLSIKVDGVNGFNIESASPTSLDNIEWKLNTLNKTQGGRIAITGLVAADTASQLNFSAHLGMWIDGTFVVIKDANQNVAITAPQISLSQQINAATDYIASPGGLLHYQIFIRNTGTTPLTNIFATAKLDGSAFDFSTLTSSEGQVRLSDNSIAWDPNQITRLQHLDPQQETSITFDVKLKNNFTPSDDQKNNVLLKNTVTVADITQEFDTKVNSSLAVISQAYFVNGQAGWQNSGPIPPKVNQATTYTLMWQVKNYFNDTKNVKVRAILPQGVNLVDNISPDNQAPNFSFDNASREIVWLVGNLSAGTGVTSVAPVIFFQVTLTPSAAQQGMAASLIGQATVSGDDQSTGSNISSTAPAVNTTLPDDQADAGGGIVQ